MTHQTLNTPIGDSHPVCEPAWIAVDWGTSNLRVWAMDTDDQVLNTASSDKGMASLEPDQFEAALLNLITDWLPADRVTPVIACGMVGAKQGWLEAPYCAVPCQPAQTSTRAPTSDPRISVMILPGVCQDEPADVMRGEETQILGFLKEQPTWSGIICLPGTHSKWVRVENGQIVQFQTFVTGELFAAFESGTVLRHSLSGDGWDDGSFKSSVNLTLESPDKAPARIFNIRAEGLLNEQSNDHSRASLSGMLIGLELNATKEFWEGQYVTLLGAHALSDRYATGLAMAGVESEIKDVSAYTLAGISHAMHKLAAE